MSSTLDSHHRVISYYDESTIDYRLVWQNCENRAFHFGYYDVHTVSHADALQNANRVLADLVGIREGDRVLDAGCGLGGSAFWVAVNRGATVVGITPVPGQVRAARELARQRALESRVRFETADYLATGLPNDSMDVAWALESSCHARDKAAFYREMYRVLRPSGRLVVADYVRADRTLQPEEEQMVHEWLDGWSIPHIITASTHERYAAQVGFEAVEVRDFTPVTRRSLRRLYKLSWVGVPIDFALHRLGMRTAVQHGNVVASRRQYQALARGCWFYGVITARKPLMTPGLAR